MPEGCDKNDSFPVLRVHFLSVIKRISSICNMTRLNFKDKRSMQPLIWAGILLLFQVASACCCNPPNQLEETTKNSGVRRPGTYYSNQHFIRVDAIPRSGAKSVLMYHHYYQWLLTLLLMLLTPQAITL